MPTRPPRHAYPSRPRHAVPETRDAAVAAVHASTAWTKLSKLKRAINPLCEDPFGEHAKAGISMPADHVHHRVPLWQNISKAYDLSNLQSLCADCHARVDAAMRRSKHNA